MKTREELVKAVKDTVAQPKREWVGLTDSEYSQIITSLYGARAFPIMAAVEAKLKEKNT